MRACVRACVRASVSTYVYIGLEHSNECSLYVCNKQPISLYISRVPEAWVAGVDAPAGGPFFFFFFASMIICTTPGSSLDSSSTPSAVTSRHGVTCNRDHTSFFLCSFFACALPSGVNLPPPPPLPPGPLAPPPSPPKDVRPPVVSSSPLSPSYY